MLGHTRWASVGIISEPNAHPVNSDEIEQPGGAEPPYVVGVLNGDVDNHADLKVEHGLRIAGPITTDAKVIPALVARHAPTGGDLVEAFRRTVADVRGHGGHRRSPPPTSRSASVLALSGSGQGVYVGLADDRFIVASEPYGVVEETSQYIRLDGETRSVRSSGARCRRRAGELDGIDRRGYDGTRAAGRRRPTSSRAEVTTRDIDRGDSPHFLLKEISEAPDSFRKTLRGKIVERDGLLHAVVGARALPPEIAARLADGAITQDPRHRAGHGGRRRAVAGRRARRARRRRRSTSTPITATELCGFGLRLDMSDTLAIAVSQSGTTTDTNRTVDLLRGRGAAVLAIVNRRNSDLTDKADGVLYTSDGRDVEMSVASTKAFYAQVAAGVAAGVRDQRGGRRRHRRSAATSC